MTANNTPHSSARKKKFQPEEIAAVISAVNKAVAKMGKEFFRRTEHDDEEMLELYEKKALEKWAAVQVLGGNAVSKWFNEFVFGKSREKILGPLRQQRYEKEHHWHSMKISDKAYKRLTKWCEKNDLTISEGLMELVKRTEENDF